MPGSRDPVERAADDRTDLYDISTWEPRSGLDRLSSRLYGWIAKSVLWLPVLVSTLLLYLEFRSGFEDTLGDPAVQALVILSVVPAFFIAGFIWYSDITDNEPIGLLLATFGLTFVLGPLAGVFNLLVPLVALALIGGIFVVLTGSDPTPDPGSGNVLDSGLAVVGDGVDAYLAATDPAAAVVGSPLQSSGALGLGLLIALLIQALYYFLVVGPVEESVKQLAVRVYAYRSRSFDAVIDGAVFGAVAGLGFATVENALYITRALETVGASTELFGGGGLGITTIRSLAGPGHVIYSGIAGYYLGLAKFNPEDAGPIVVKGIVIASVFHGGYNFLVGLVPQTLVNVTGMPTEAAIVAFILVYDSAMAYFLYRKIKGYREAYHTVGAAEPAENEVVPDATEFEPPSQDRYS
jgi:RsiW-degrading membrane proteinase PrsW (M82 family)